MFNNSPSHGLAFDLNSDGRTDYLVGAVDRTSVLLQTEVGEFKSRSLSMPTPDAGWAVEGTGDLDGDKFRDDLLWRNTVTGLTVFELGQGDQPSQIAYSSAHIPTYSPYLSDFNGDGKTDILWHNPQQGKAEIWFLEGDRIGQSLPLPNMPSSWVPRLADFNQDGKTDLFWQDNATGEFTIWLLDGDQLIGNSRVELPGNSGSLELYDFTGDGRTDIFDRNRLTGINRLWVWGEDGLSPKPEPVMLPFAKPDGAFNFGDFNGDGRTDSLFRTSGIGSAFWLTQADGTVAISDLPNLTGLVIDQIADFDRDGKVDLLLENPSINQFQLWLLDGPIVKQVKQFTIDLDTTAPAKVVPSIPTVLVGAPTIEPIVL